MYQENNGFLEEVFDMRKILKIIVAPFVLVLILAVAVISFLSCIRGRAAALRVRFLSCWQSAAFLPDWKPGASHVGAGVPRFSLWTSGHRGLAPGSPVWDEIRLAGFYV